MSNIREDHAAAFIALLTAAGLTAFDGEVTGAAPETYVLVYTLFQRPDGSAAPDAISLAGTSIALDVWAYVHCVSSTAASARALSALVEAAVLDRVLTVAGRVCAPIRWREGQLARRDEEIPGKPVHDVVDVYGWRSLPA